MSLDFTPPSSIVKYSEPKLVSEKKGTKKSESGLAGMTKQLDPTVELLNSILPPREFTKNGQLWVQYVSSTPATRLDVTSLQDELEKRLREMKAHMTGICPVRQGLYAECFDELIRQVSIDSGEMGLLLLRIRDEMLRSLAAYQRRFENGVAYSMRKALMADCRRTEYGREIRELETDCADLELKLRSIRASIEETESQQAEQEEADHQKFEEEIQRRQQDIDAKKQLLEKVLGVPDEE